MSNSSLPLRGENRALPFMKVCLKEGQDCELKAGLRVEMTHTPTGLPKMFLGM